MERYRPQIPFERWESVRRFVEDCVGVIAPACAYLAERLMVVVSRFVDWVVNVSGYAMVAGTVFHPVMIRRYVGRDDTDWSDKTRRDYRSFLLRISEVACPDAGPVKFRALNSQAHTAPYTGQELDLLKAWATGQNSVLRRRSAGALLGLCAGAGLEAYEVQNLRRRDVQRDEHGIFIATGDRIIPLLDSWSDLLTGAIGGLDPDQWVFGGASRETAFNVVTGFIRSTHRGSEPTPIPTRMRATWIVTHLAARTHAAHLLRAAGLSKARHLTELLIHIPDLDTAEHRRRVLAEARTGA